jgi:hypothetical protein
MRFVPERILRCGLVSTNGLSYIDFAEQSCLLAIYAKEI